MAYGRAFVCILALAAPPTAAAQLAVSAPNGFAIHLRARIEPGAAEVPGAVMAGVVGHVRRVVLDQNGRRYFAYDLMLDAKDGSDALQVRLEPPSLSAAELRVMGVDPSWRPVPLVKYPLVPDVHAEDTVTIDLLENRATGQRVVDQLVFKRWIGPAAAPAASAPPRDFSLDDLQLYLKDFRISVNGALLDESTRVGGEIGGTVLWLYLPERGRFVMSLLPNPKLGFRRAGEVAGNSLTFTAGQERYEIRSADRIAPAGGRFHLYVKHDPQWRPKNDASSAPFVIGAAGRVEWLIAK